MSKAWDAQGQRLGILCPFSFQWPAKEVASQPVGTTMRWRRGAAAPRGRDVALKGVKNVFFRDLKKKISLFLCVKHKYTYSI